jgi:hypothetical protein
LDVVKTWLKRFALAVSSLVIVLLLCELGLRVFMPGEFIPCVERDQILGWRGRPDLSCIYRHDYFGLAFPLATNSRGFRDREHAPTAPQGVTRVLFVGDSFTWGWGVGEDTVYTRLFENRLAARGASVEAINAGVPGYNTVQSLLYLKEHGFDYAPDVVVYQAMGNDLPDNRYCAPGFVWLYPYARLREDGGVTVEGTPLPDLTLLQNLKYHGARHSRLLYLVKSRIDCRRKAKEMAAHARYSLNPALEAEAAAFSLFAALVREMHAQCAAHGARLVVLLEMPLTDGELAHLAETCPGADLLPVTALLKDHEASSGTTVYRPADGHWTQAGHDRVATYLADRALSDGWLPPGL